MAKKHTKIYMDFFGYTKGDYIPSEMSGAPCQAVHHISPRGMGGSKTKDYIENLVGLTHVEHDKAESDKSYNEQVRIKHIEFIKTHRPDYKSSYLY